MVFPEDLARAGEQARKNGRCSARARGIWAELLAVAGGRRWLEGENAPSITGLAKRVGIDRDTLHRYLEDFKEAGLLELALPPGKKPVWRIHSALSAGVDLPHGAAGGEPVSHSACGAASFGSSCRTVPLGLPHDAAPVPAREREKERREIVGAGHLWKGASGSAEDEELEGVVRMVGARVEEMRSEDPEGADALEELALNEATDVESWRRLLELGGVVGSP